VVRSVTLTQAHPAADRVTTEALVVEQDRVVVGLSTWLADAAVAAGRTGRVLQVLTPAYSVVTYPLELLLGEGVQWVVRDGSGFRDGLTGADLRWAGSRFAPAGSAPPAPPAATAGTGGIEVLLTARHAARDGTELGAAAAAAVRALAGVEPDGWGIGEPATQPWSPRALTAYCRERAPAPTALVVVGGGFVGRLHAERVAGGVAEELRLAGPAATAVGTDAVEALADAVGERARTMVVGVHPGRLDGLRPAGPSLPALPYGVLLGAEVVATRGVDHARRAPASSVRLVGDTACWCRLDGAAAPYEQLAAVLAHFGASEADR
jgi:hypothetical protein